MREKSRGMTEPILNRLGEEDRKGCSGLWKTHAEREEEGGVCDRCLKDSPAHAHGLTELSHACT